MVRADSQVPPYDALPIAVTTAAEVIVRVDGDNADGGIRGVAEGDGDGDTGSPGVPARELM